MIREVLGERSDHDELLAWVGAATPPPQTVYLAHGEQQGATALRDAIESRLGWQAVVPRHLERVRIG